MTVDIVIIGGGAAGFFTAINIAEANPELRIVLLERGKEVLTKVKISGGGRCNVTHAEFVPKELATNYPRGEKELLGPFHSFMTGDTMAWFEKRGVKLKIEADGRVFPETDSSKTIIDCFQAEVKRLGITLMLNQPVRDLRHENGIWQVYTVSEEFKANTVVLATGSNPKIWKLMESLGHNLVPPVPSLFTFHIVDDRIKDLPGISTEAGIRIISEENEPLLDSEGPLLITHWGMSGPAILKLSAWGARLLQPLDYQFKIHVNWLIDMEAAAVVRQLLTLKSSLGKRRVSASTQFELPKRLWQNLVSAAGIAETVTWAELNKSEIELLSKQLTQGQFVVHGKSTFKEEFVTAGGIELKEVNFKTFESKLYKNLYFAGEILNIDAITGGFNFQNAWTGGFMIAQAITRSTA